MYVSIHSLRHHIHANLGHIVGALVLSELSFKHVILLFLIVSYCSFSFSNHSFWWGQTCQTEGRILHTQTHRHTGQMIGVNYMDKWQKWMNEWMLNLISQQTSFLLASLLAASFSAANPAASFRYLLPTLLSNHFRSTNTSLKCSLSNWKKEGMGGEKRKNIYTIISHWPSCNNSLRNPLHLISFHFTLTLWQTDWTAQTKSDDFLSVSVADAQTPILDILKVKQKDFKLGLCDMTI